VITNSAVILMSSKKKYLGILSGMLTAGAVGIALLLGSATPGDATDHAPDAQPFASGAVGVSERLAAIREAASAVAPSETTAAKGAARLALGNNALWANFHDSDKTARRPCPCAVSSRHTPSSPCEPSWTSLASSGAATQTTKFAKEIPDGQRQRHVTKTRYG
jgi:hypothetical protein